MTDMSRRAFLKRASASVVAAPIAACVARPIPLSAPSASAIPDRLLAAIGIVESGRTDPVGGGVHPWPWSINAAGQDMVHYGESFFMSVQRRLAK